MADVLTAIQRSYCMSRIQARDTKPEMIVRNHVFRMGYRYRLHRKDLPGKPDLVFPKLNKIINVHGCFWHMHNCPNGRVSPKTNAEFWQEKRRGNVTRDAAAFNALCARGWRVLTVWECEIKNQSAFQTRLQDFLIS
jgi:DNA mismatch endonuclease, patch repair protein